MKNIFVKPYPTNIPSSWWKISAFFSLFVFLFLLVFRPFGLGEVQNNFIAIAAGYGLTSFIILVLLNILVAKLFFRFFSEQKWTVGKEIFWTLVNILSIGIANEIYSYYLGFFPLNMEYIFRFITYTAVIGLFPVSIFTLVRQTRLEKKFVIQSDEINETVAHHNEMPGKLGATSTLINIPSENANEDFSVPVFDLLFIRSADNYVEIFFMEKNNLRKKIIRNSMKNMKTPLQEHRQFFRCHKSFLVNLDKVSHVSGNAQGLKLHLHNTDELIPVSRNFTKIIRDKFAVRK